MEMGDHTAALEYLVLSKNYDTAFEVARKNGEVQLFADILGDQAQQEDYNKIGLYYENERKYLLSGKYFALAGHHTKVILRNLSNGIEYYWRLKFNCPIKWFRLKLLQCFQYFMSASFLIW